MYQLIISAGTEERCNLELKQHMGGWVQLLLAFGALVKFEV